MNIRPWVRIEGDYSYTRMIREQLFTSLQPLTGTGVVAGSAEGTVYRDFKTRLHGASLTGEFDLVELFGRGKGPGRFGLWLGTGVGTRLPFIQLIAALSSSAPTKTIPALCIEQNAGTDAE